MSILQFSSILSVERDRLKSPASPGSKAEAVASPTDESIWCWWDVLVLVAALALIAMVRVRLSALPLERDEGEYAYGAQLLLEGGLPYRDLYSMKWPGMYAAYGLIFASFGQTIVAIHAGLLIVNLATALGVYALARQLLSRPFAVFAAVCFLTLSLSPAVHGIIANAEHFAVVWVVYGLWLLWKALGAGSWRWAMFAGALMAMGAVMKQQAVFFVAFGGLTTLLVPWPQGRSQTILNGKLALAFSGGAGAVWGAMAIAVWQAGVWSEFYELTVVYARSYTSQVPLALAPSLFIQQFSAVLKASWPIYLLAAWGLAAAIAKPWRERIWLLGLAATSFAAVCPGFYFRQHYFLFLPPAVTVLAAAAAQQLWNRVGDSEGLKWAALACFSLALAWPLAFDAELLFELSPEAVSRAMYGQNPFVESPRIADFIQRHVAPGERFVILGSEPQLCFYSHRRSATGFIYMYPLMENHPLAEQMQKQMIAEVEASNPSYAVLIRTQMSWLPGPDSKQFLFRWMDEFLEGYEPCGYAEIVSSEETAYAFDRPEAASPPPNSVAVILRRKAPTTQSN